MEREREGKGWRDDLDEFLGNSPLPFRSRDYLGKTRSLGTIPVRCSPFVWTRRGRDSIERKTLPRLEGNKILQVE